MYLHTQAKDKEEAVSVQRMKTQVDMHGQGEYALTDVDKSQTHQMSAYRDHIEYDSFSRSGVSK